MKKQGMSLQLKKNADNRFLLYDPQNGNFLNFNQLIDAQSLEILKVDKLVLDKGVLKAISEII